MARYPVAVGVERRHDVGVAQKLLDELGVLPLTQRPTRSNLALGLEHL
jgi:hypothetical protein